jgi:hypothetical protein
MHAASDAYSQTGTPDLVAPFMCEQSCERFVFRDFYHGVECSCRHVHEHVPRLPRHLTPDRGCLRTHRANLLDFLSHQAQTFGAPDERIYGYMWICSMELQDPSC